MRCTNSNIWVVLFCCKQILTMIPNCIYFLKANKVICFHIETHSVSLTWLHQHLLRLLKPRLLSLLEHLGGIMQIFPHRDVDMWRRVWMRHVRGVWMSLNFYKEYLFGFETLVFATLGILSMHNQLVTLQRERKTWNRIIWPLKFFNDWQH